MGHGWLPCTALGPLRSPTANEQSDSLQATLCAQAAAGGSAAGVPRQPLVALDLDFQLRLVNECLFKSGAPAGGSGKPLKTTQASQLVAGLSLLAECHLLGSQKQPWAVCLQVSLDSTPGRAGACQPKKLGKVPPCAGCCTSLVRRLERERRPASQLTPLRSVQDPGRPLRGSRGPSVQPLGSEARHKQGTRAYRASLKPA